MDKMFFVINVVDFVKDKIEFEIVIDYVSVEFVKEGIYELQFFIVLSKEELLGSLELFYNQFLKVRKCLDWFIEVDVKKVLVVQFSLEVDKLCEMVFQFY